MKKLFLLVIFGLFYCGSVFGLNVNEEEKACLLQGSNLVETDFITVGTSSDLNGTYYVDEDLIYELDFSNCGFMLETEEVFENVWMLDISHLNLTSFDLSKYPSVSFVNAGYNNLTDITISTPSDLEYLIELDVSHNDISYSQTILNLIESNSTSININNNPITNEYYHALYTLGVDLDYRPGLILYLNNIPQDPTLTSLHYIATSTDLHIDTKYATTMSIQTATGTDLMYQPNMTLLPGDYVITVSNDKYQTITQLTVILPVEEQEEQPSVPEDVPDEEQEPTQSSVPNEEEKQEEPKNEIEEQPKEEIEDIEEIEIPDGVIEEIIEEPIQNIEEEESEEVVIEEQMPSDDTEPGEEPLLEVLPNTYDRDVRLLVFGWSCLVISVVLWYWENIKKFLK